MGQPKGGHPAKRLLKGQTWQVEEMLKLFLVIIVFGGAVLLIIGATGGLTSVLNDFCEKNPKWCGQSSATDDDYEIAKASVEALVCAINTVANGGKLSGCLYGSPPDKETTGLAIGKEVRDFMTGLATAAASDSDENKPTVACDPKVIGVKCNCRYMSAYGTSERIGDVIEVEDQDKDSAEEKAQEICEDRIKEQGYSGQITPYVTCGDWEEMRCSVYNFQLPQRFEDTALFSEWIGGFGDPLFLVYWQAFPLGEDADWSGKASWYKGIGTIAFGAMCLFGLKRGAVSAIKAGGKVVSSTSKRAANYMVDKIKNLKGSKEAVQKATKTFSNVDEFADHLAKIKRVSTATSTRNSIFYGIKPTIANTITSSGEGAKSFSMFNKMKAALPETVGYTAVISGINTLDAFVWSRIDSEFGKFFPDEKEPDKIMLHMPLNEREPSDLLTEKREIPVLSEAVADPHTHNIIKLNKPVLLAKEGYDLWVTDVGDEMKPLWFASPCRTDLRVSETEVTCQIYSYDITTGLTTCLTPEKPSFFESAEIYRVGCGSIPNIGKDLNKVSEVSLKEAEFIQDMDSVQVFGKTADAADIRSVSRELGKQLECSCRVIGIYSGPDPYKAKGSTIEDVLNDCYTFASGVEGLDKTKIKSGMTLSYCEEKGTSESSTDKVKVRKCTCTINFQEDTHEGSSIGNSVSYPVYGLSESDAESKCRADYESFEGYERTRIDYKLSPCDDYEGNFAVPEVIYDPINKISFYYDKTTEEVEYSKNAEGVITNQDSVCSPEEPNTFFNTTGFGIDKIFKCELEFGKDPDGRDIVYNFIGTVADDGETLGEFIGLRIDYINKAKIEDPIAKSIILKDFSTITVGEEKKLNLDGKIDEVGDYLYLPGIIDKIIYQRAFVDNSPYDGIPDSVTSTDCKVRAIVVQPDMEPYKDGDEPNYCYKTNYDSVVDVVSTTASIGVSVFTKVAKFGGPLGWVLSTFTDCGLAIYSATSGTSWPNH